MTDKNRIFRKTERCLYGYKSNAARLETLRLELAALRASSSVKVQNYTTAGTMPSGGVHDPVAERIDRIQSAEDRVRNIERITLPLERLMRDIDSPDILPNSSLFGLADILKMYYLNGNIWFDVAERLNLGKSAFFKKRRRLVRCAAEYLGFSDEPRLFLWGDDLPPKTQKGGALAGN